MAGGWLYAILLGCQAWESRRFARGRQRQLPMPPPDHPRVALFVPCKGYDLQLADNLRALFNQSYPNYELVFVVESGHDPACATIRELMVRRREIPSRLVIAGQSTDSGQKVHNLLVATAQVSSRVQILAFADSDARPHPGWLGCLISGLDKEGVGATTGYRWMFPLRRKLANYLLYSINSATAALYGPRGPVLVWGGSWAIRTETFEAIGLRDAWEGTLSDDMVASRTLYDAGYRIHFEPGCVTVSPVDATFGGVLEFLRRQFLIGRRYCGPMWIGAFAALAFSQLALWGSLAVGLWAVAAGNLHGLLGLVNFAGLYAGTMYRCWLRQEAGRACLPERQSQLNRARRFDILAGPAVGPLNLLAFLAACWGNCITWRDVRYRIDRGGQIAVLSRRDTPPATPAIEFAPPPPLRRAA